MANPYVSSWVVTESFLDQPLSFPLRDDFLLPKLIEVAVVRTPLISGRPSLIWVIKHTQMLPKSQALDCLYLPVIRAMEISLRSADMGMAH